MTSGLSNSMFAVTRCMVVEPAGAVSAVPVRYMSLTHTTLPNANATATAARARFRVTAATTASGYAGSNSHIPMPWTPMSSG